LQSAHERVTLVPHSGKGKNALDFHLSFYLGYVAAKHPEANLMVVANDKGYDSMIGHAKDLGFTATRVGFKARKTPATKKAAAPAKKKPAATKKAQPAAKKVKSAPAPPKQAAKAVEPAKAPAAKKAPAKSPAALAAPAKKAPAKKVPAEKAAAKAAPTKQAPAAKAAASPVDKVLARARTSLAKMGKNRPTKLSKLLRHLKSIVGQGATEADADALSRRLEAANVIQVVGDLVLYP
jgi:outer membrane biosynthesis protein TonB